ncbi:MAG: GNAT family N-acetyltransferase [Bacteroidia bacterium]
MHLRRVNDADVNEVFELRSNPDIMHFIPRPLAKDREDAMEHIKKIDDKINENESINWGITLKSESKLIGILGFVRMTKDHFRAEVGYLLHPDQHRKGIIPEALKAVIEYGFREMKLHSIEAVVDPENKASIRVLEKSNFIKEAHFKEKEFYKGKFNDTAVYSLLTNYSPGSI